MQSRGRPFHGLGCGTQLSPGLFAALRVCAWSTINDGRAIDDGSVSWVSFLGDWR
jgi:hypothetical protein